MALTCFKNFLPTRTVTHNHTTSLRLSFFLEFVTAARSQTNSYCHIQFVTGNHTIFLCLELLEPTNHTTI